MVRGTETTGMRHEIAPIDKLVRGNEECFGTFVFGPLGILRVVVWVLTSLVLFFAVLKVLYCAYLVQSSGGGRSYFE